MGAAGIGYIGPISTLIIIILMVVYFSYRQTIGAILTAAARTPWPGRIWA